MAAVNYLDRLKSLFHGALELPEDVDARVWLEAHCGEDQALLQEVRSLVEANAEMRGGAAAGAAAQAAIPSAQFGAYRAVECVGRGGMSTVYRARRTDGNFE